MIMPLSDDPLSLAILPPPDESHEDKLRRELKEKQDKAISDAIDLSIKQERAVRSHSFFLLHIHSFL